MLKYFTVLIFLVVLFSHDTLANVYASGIRISDDAVANYDEAGTTWDGNMANGGVKIWFIINEDGGGAGSVSAAINIKQGNTVIRTINASSLSKGVNSVVWDGYNNSSAAASTGSYSFEITVSDAVGHSAFDSLWVAGAFYEGSDLEGGSSFAYRGNATISDESQSLFGNLFVARGTSSNNGFYQLRADGLYIQKIATSPTWPASTPNEVAAVGGNVVGIAGYGFTGAGFARSYDAAANTFLDSIGFGTNSVRGLAVRIEGADTVYYTCRGGTGVNAIIKKIGVNGDTSTVVDLNQYISGGGYVKSVTLDDDGNAYVAFGNASAARKKIAKFNSSGGLVFLDSLDGTFALASTAIFQSLAIDRGANLSSASDDKLYALVQSGTSSQNGIYSLQLNGSSATQLISPLGITTAATSQIINTDPAGNVVWSNGAASERIIVFSPASGPNSYTTSNPSGTDVVISTAVPVELTSFTARIVENKVVLNWITATETNNKGFEIEKYADAKWIKIGYVDGKGTSTQVTEYSFVDKNTVSGKVEYRLKQIDFDGSFTYSKSVEVEVGLVNDFTLEQNYPNPFNPTTTISFNLPFDSQVTLQIYTTNGELVETLMNEFKSAGAYNIEFNAANLASGTYVYRLSSGSMVLNKKMSLLK